jgi:hypothetical protein
MIVDTLQQVITEVSGLWSWIIGIVAGWGLTFTIVVSALIVAHVKIAKLTRRIYNLENRQVTDSRELSFRITKIENDNT